MKKTIIFSFIMFVVLCGIFVGIKNYQETSPEEKKAEKLLKKYKEKELLPLIEKYYKALMSFDSAEIYEVDENENFNYSEKFLSATRPFFKEIKEFHIKNHNEEIIPRDSDEWNEWMNCSKYIDPEYQTILDNIENDLRNKTKITNNKYVTYCPFCLAIERIKKQKNIEKDFVPSFEETYLYSAPQFRKKLYSGLKAISDEEELREIIKNKLDPIMNNGSMFSLMQKDEIYGSYKGESGDTYYINITNEYRNVIQELLKFHNEHHHMYYNDFENIWMHEKRKYDKYRPQKSANYDWYKKDMGWWKEDENYDNNEFIKHINNGDIPACPICILMDDRHQEGNTSNALDYSELYPFSIQIMSRFYKFVDKVEEIKNAVSIQNVGDAIKKNEVTGIRNWNNKSGIFYGTISEISESNYWYDGNKWSHDPVYFIKVWCENSWLSAREAKLTILQSELPYSVVSNLRKGQEIYFKGRLDIDEMGFIDVENVSLIDSKLVKNIKESRTAKNKTNEDDLVRALANLFIGSATPLTESDFE